ncbi:MAG TPA: hypothetical protein VJ596_04685 [Gemmatimonadaceae bacterium]|nr:hypothetical protein [Gemmatimonadaceae bacterium]
MSADITTPHDADAGDRLTAPLMRQDCRWFSLARDGVTQLFVHSSSSLRDYGTLVASTPNVAYSTPQRALLLAEQGDIVCLAAPIDPDFLDYLTELNVGPRRDHIVVLGDASPIAQAPSLAQRLLANREKLERVAALIPPGRSVLVSPYVVSHGEAALCTALAESIGRPVRLLGGTPEIVDLAYHKHLLKARARELGVTVVDGEVVEIQPSPGGGADISALREAMGRHRAATGRVLIRGSYGTAARSTFIAGPDDESAERALSEVARRDDNRFYVVEPLIDLVVSPNVQMYVDPFDGTIDCLNVTDQIWQGELKHGGNIFPSRATTSSEMCGAAQQITEWMRDSGYTGIVGFDFVEYVDRDSGAARFFVAEANPRINGATYPTKVAERLARSRPDGLPPRAFATRRVATKARTFGAFRALHGELFYDRATGRGIVPLTPVSTVSGRVLLMMVGASREDVQREQASLAATIESREARITG